MCTGNPNHTSTVSMRCHNTWPLCPQANFEWGLKVDRVRRKKHLRKGTRERSQMERNAILCLLPYHRCSVKPKAERCPHLTQVLWGALISAQAELVDHHWIFSPVIMKTNKFINILNSKGIAGFMCETCSFIEHVRQCMSILHRSGNSLLYF